jgi:hypothetical protein
MGEALADDTGKCGDGAVGIIAAERSAIIIPELIFGQIAVQMLLATVLIDTLHAALEDAEIALHGVAVDAAILKVHIRLALLDRVAL